jgi:hypothetical protein
MIDMNPTTHHCGWLRRLLRRFAGTLLAVATLAGHNMGVSVAATPELDRALSFSTYLGGSGDEGDDFRGAVVSVAVDSDGNAYVTGTTQSPDFPTTSGTRLNGKQDIFVTKFSPTGAVLYSTYVGGPCDDIARGIAVDASGNAYITGRANAGFCLWGPTPGVLVAKLGPNGALVYALVFGGSLADTSSGHAIKINAAGQAYVTGVAASSSNDFPVTPGAFRTTPCEDVWYTADGFVAKIDASGTRLLYSTYLCGTGADSPNSIAIDAAGNAYVAGSTTSRDFPTVNALQPALRSEWNANGFLSKLSADGASLVYSTYLGGTTDDAIAGIALDGQGNVYVTGQTSSADFPTTPGVVQEQPGYRLCVPLGPCYDAFVTKIDPSGSAIVYSTYLFGELDDGGNAIAIDATGNAYVVGTTTSQFFPILDPFQWRRGGTFDGFFAVLSPDGTRLVRSSYLGGSRSVRNLITGWDEATGIALDTAGNAYVVGFTQSDDFPTTSGAVQQQIGGGGCDAIGLACRDAFVTRIPAGGAGVAPDISLDVTPADAAPGATLTATWAGVPGTVSDVLGLYILGTSGGVAYALATWPTGGAAGGTLDLSLPSELSPGTYELRLLSPDPNYFGIPTPIVRSEPIRITG